MKFLSLNETKHPAPFRAPALNRMPHSSSPHAKEAGEKSSFYHALSNIPTNSINDGTRSQSCLLASVPTPKACPFGGACHKCPARIQTKLAISQPGDEYEQEADRVSEQIMTMPDPVAANPKGGTIQRKCASCEDDENKVQRKSSPEYGAGDLDDAPTIVNEVLHSPGQPLDDQTRAFMEPRFGHDFSGVRVHTDAKAAESARAVNALAYTVGRDVVFGTGRYVPCRDSGRRLLAHELSHIEQSAGITNPLSMVRRQIDNNEELEDPRQYSDGAPKAVTCSPPSHCPKTFCQPYSSENFARKQLEKMTPFLLLGIAVKVGTRVVSLWSEHLSGGSSKKDLTGQFAKDFIESKTTIETNKFLITALTEKLKSSPPSFPPGKNIISIDIPTFIPAEVAEIDVPDSEHEMNFNYPKEVPGNLAGGIGKNQTSCQAGATPSPFNDQRIVEGSALVYKDRQENLFVMPSLSYTVKDTIDLCPGDCGEPMEQIATIPISQFEATGISGDVPFEVKFSPSIPSILIEKNTMSKTSPPIQKK